MIFAHYNSLVVIYFATFTIIVMISSLINRLGEEKRKRTAGNCSGGRETHDEAKSEKCLLEELYSAADKCFIEKYAKTCRKLSAAWPNLINAKYSLTGQTPFHRVCFHGEAPLIEFLLNKGADPYLKSSDGESPMCFAIYYYLHTNDFGEDEPLVCLEILQSAGCVLDANNIWYDALLTTSIRTNKKELTKWLFMNKTKTPIERIASGHL
ncbi:uncharacterized protein [Venturia canescens]|uniref:uncharacterized protein n=1 Tax=Venturia canescens TaxID=32260 RepID=UPI001C9BC51C|nr:uncharacterized protein LOC122414698 [Venturia canescens]